MSFIVDRVTSAINAADPTSIYRASSQKSHMVKRTVYSVFLLRVLLALRFMTLKAQVDIILYLSAEKSEPVCTARCIWGAEYSTTLHVESNIMYIFTLSHTLIGVSGLRV
jgi:hypothetical protein